jgi:hypothetical protein
MAKVKAGGQKENFEFHANVPTKKAGCASRLFYANAVSLLRQ